MEVFEARSINQVDESTCLSDSLNNYSFAFAQLLYSDDQFLFILLSSPHSWHFASRLCLGLESFATHTKQIYLSRKTLFKKTEVGKGDSLGRGARSQIVQAYYLKNPTSNRSAPCTVI